MTRTILFAAATLAAFGTATMSPTKADAAIETLGECYDAVITWCNETFPDHDCSLPSGLDDCDEEFGNQIGGGAINRLQTLGGKPGRATLKLVPLQIKRVRTLNN